MKFSVANSFISISSDKSITACSTVNPEQAGCTFFFRRIRLLKQKKWSIKGCSFFSYGLVLMSCPEIWLVADKTASPFG